jgi:PST family polysaccharide transporter/lipopolysaccharide exporter
MFGIAGTALTVTLIYVFPMMPLDLYIIRRTLDATYGEILYEFTYPLIASVIMFAGVWAVHLSVEIMPLLKFGLLTLTGVVLYVLSVLLLEIQFNWGIRENITTLISNVKS